MNEISRDSHFYCFLHFIIDVLYIISTGGYNCVDSRILVFLLASFIVSLFLLPALAVIRRLTCRCKYYTFLFYNLGTLSTP